MDVAQIHEAIGLATNAVGLTGQAASTVDTIKKLFTSDNAPDSGEAAKLLNSLAGELTAANMMNVQLSKTLKELSEELQRQAEFEQEKARYELFKTPQNDMVFKLKEDSTNGEPSHFICPVCLKRDKLISYITGDQYYKICQTDKSHGYDFLEAPPLGRGY